MSDPLANRIDDSIGNARDLGKSLGETGTAHGSPAVFPWNLHPDGPSRVIPLEWGRSGGGLELRPNVIRLRPREPVATHAQASSEFYYVVRGQGRSRAGDRTTEWHPGDSFVLPRDRRPFISHSRIRL